ncbi:hypothetical protein Leryth_013641 [Lithospermum erythrorhizon]|uniref:RING-type E3 ubiquitin transferase n=1 Tax=Lithospermum erythrorhizon TaxID=34254 RepID=A0AAV3QR02_LITER|nr:hypothetical protein Leryth_013641 [Lithospermum erythrorhizon]
MGGCCCCCASRQAEIRNLSPLYPYPRESEEREPLSHRGRISAVSTGLLVDTNLDTSIPDTYRPPPAPIPYEVLTGRQWPPPGNQESSGSHSEAAVQPINLDLAGEANSVNDMVTTVKDLKGSDNNAKFENELSTPKEVEDEIENSGELKKSSQRTNFILEECPTCLEEYDEENPKIMTKCEHHFHMSCILEWLERSDNCPVCGQEMVFDDLINVLLSAMGHKMVKGEGSGVKDFAMLSYLNDQGRNHHLEVVIELEWVLDYPTRVTLPTRWFKSEAFRYASLELFRLRT